MHGLGEGAWTGGPSLEQSTRSGRGVFTKADGGGPAPMPSAAVQCQPVSARPSLQRINAVPTQLQREGPAAREARLGFIPAVSRLIPPQARPCASAAARGT
jgi:hypothetical protein